MWIDLALTLGIVVFLGIVYLGGYSHGFTDADRRWEFLLHERVIETQRALEREAAKLTAPLACPICGAGRSNAEVARGWCANCGVYHDG